jgi:hypothetical protein
MDTSTVTCTLCAPMLADPHAHILPMNSDHIHGSYIDTDELLDKALPERILTVADVSTSSGRGFCGCKLLIESWEAYSAIFQLRYANLRAFSEAGYLPHNDLLTARLIFTPTTIMNRGIGFRDATFELYMSFEVGNICEGIPAPLQASRRCLLLRRSLTNAYNCCTFLKALACAASIETEPLPDACLSTIRVWHGLCKELNEICEFRSEMPPRTLLWDRNSSLMFTSTN